MSPTPSIAPPPGHGTIVARATAAGMGAIAIVRLSGPQALSILKVLTPRATAARQPHRLYRAGLYSGDGTLLDDALVVEMPAPHSYTGEDMAELHTHGAPGLVQAVLDACWAAGARQAAAGEFTLRAYLNGRMDLSQAEAVADLLGAQSTAERQAAARQLQGGLRGRLQPLLDSLQNLLAHWRAAMDFPDYDTGEGLDAGDAQVLTEALQGVQDLLSSAQITGQRGDLVVLSGAPNVGKSTLLNAWAGEPRVLVDGESGTTRDPVEVCLEHHGRRLRVCDTAGLRAGGEALERRGMALSRQWMQRADLSVWLVAGNAPQWPPPQVQVDAVLGSKHDLCSAADCAAVEAEAERRGLTFLGWVTQCQPLQMAAMLDPVVAWLEGEQKLTTSEPALTASQRALSRTSGSLGNDLTALPTFPVSGPAAVLQPPSDASWSARRRHLEALQEARSGLQQALVGLRRGQPLDMLAYDVEGATKALGAVLGRDIDTAILDAIFAEFCIGK
jgi:tRNA modification GTPase